MDFGAWGGSSYVNTTADLTGWSAEKLATFGKELGIVQMSQYSSSTLVLDKATIQTISSPNNNVSIRINSDENTQDYVVLKDFTAAEKVGEMALYGGTRVFDQYKFTGDNGSTYSLLIEDDVQVTFG